MNTVVINRGKPHDRDVSEAFGVPLVATQEVGARAVMFIVDSTDALGHLRQIIESGGQKRLAGVVAWKIPEIAVQQVVATAQRVECPVFIGLPESGPPVPVDPSEALHVSTELGKIEALLNRAVSQRRTQ
jgi:hypothetical protein